MNTKKASFLSIILTATLILSKLLASYLSHSLALRSDAYNSLSDLIASLTMFFGLQFASKNPTDRFKYGFYKVENFSTIIISLFIIYVGIDSLISGFNSFFNPIVLENIPFAVGVSILSIFLSALMSNFLTKTGKKTNSPSLLASGKERRGDILISSVVLIGIIFSTFHIKYLEGIIAVLISIWVIGVGCMILKDAILDLLDIAPDKKINSFIEILLNNHPKIKSFEGLRLRKAGAKVFGEVKVKILGSLDLMRTHEILEEIEKQIQKEYPEVISIMMHPEPVGYELSRIIIPIKKYVKNLKCEISNQYGKSENLLIVDISEGKNNFKEIDYFPNPYIEKKSRAGLDLSKYIVENKQFDAILTTGIGEISFNYFREKVVTIHKIPKQMNLIEVLDNLIDKKLEIFTEFTNVK